MTLTQSQDRTDVTVPRATWDVLEREVLGPASEDDTSGYALAMSGVVRRKHSVALRYRMDEARGRAGAEWMRFMCRKIADTPAYGVAHMLAEKQTVLARVADELAEALRGTEAPHGS